MLPRSPMPRSSDWTHFVANATRALTVAVCMVAVGVAAPRPAEAQLNVLPPELDGVDIQPNFDAQVPLDLAFLDESGREVRLGDLIDGSKPVVIALVYYECPQLCNLVLTGLCDGFAALVGDGPVDVRIRPAADGSIDRLPESQWLRVGEDFTAITISFHIGEGPELAREKKASHLEVYEKPEWAEGWHWLSSKGYRENVRELARTLGFYYRIDPNIDPAQTHYAHSSGIFILTPSGRLSTAFPGITYPARNLRYGLLEAAQGTINMSLIDQAFLSCFRYDPNSNSYVADARRIMMLGGILMVLLLGGFLGTMWLRDLRRRALRVVSADDSTNAQADFEAADPSQAKE